MKNRVAIQGIEGSFHHQVAREYFGSEVLVEECMSFGEVARSLTGGRADRAVMAIENSIAGSILPNYALIDENNLEIIGEHYIPIKMNLMAVPGRKIGDIKKVYSHPMALLQCKEFFSKHPHIKLVEDADTASVAKRISENNSQHSAAVASKTAAELFNLEIIAEDIHTIKSNTTRFLILSSEEKQAITPAAGKASLKFVMENRQGSLLSILTILKDYNLDMTKIQSVPVIEMPWKYAFFIDVIFEDQDQFNSAIRILEVMTEQLKVLGTYKNRLV